MTDLHRLHEDHVSFRPTVDAIKETADRVGDTSIAGLRALVAGNRRALDGDLLPHLTAEDEVLFPVLQRVLASERATVGIEHDHALIRRFVAEMADTERMLEGVDELSPELASQVRRVFYGLYALLLAHFEKEELHYLPYLRRDLDEDAQRSLIDGMDAAAARHRAAAPA